MDIAQQKRKENIAEYILYLWQLEDLLRALQFSPEAIYSTLVKPRKLDTQHEQILLAWYMDIQGCWRRSRRSSRDTSTTRYTLFTTCMTSTCD